MTMRKTGMTLVFTKTSAGADTARLSSVEDRDGNKINYTSSGSPIKTDRITDTTGNRRVDFTYISGRVTGMAEPWPQGRPGPGPGPAPTTGLVT